MPRLTQKKIITAVYRILHTYCLTKLENAQVTKTDHLSPLETLVQKK